ncbi:hypothetical protein F4824DRAFT_259849 [Ustulina deusta]|nr:hypothetical protein F4824DRAFT_259849 [Ustulina deusta]
MEKRYSIRLLPESSTSPDTVFTFLLKLRSALLTRFVCCRAQVASVLRESNRTHILPYTGRASYTDAFRYDQKPSARIMTVSVLGTNLSHVRRR